MLVSNQEMSLINIKKIRLFLCLPNQSIKVVIVTENSKVSIFEEVFENKNNIYAYNGNVLCISKKISFYGMKQNDRIFVLKSKEELENYRKTNLQLDDTFKIYTNNIQNGKNDIVTKAIIDSKFRNELARLNDLKLMKLDMKRRRIFKRVEVQIEKQRPHIETIIPEKPSSISTDPLPIFF